MKKNRWVLLPLVVWVIVALACSGGGDGETVVPSTSPPKDVSTKEPEGATLEITNNSGVEIWYVYLSPSKAEDWGEEIEILCQNLEGSRSQVKYAQL